MYDLTQVEADALIALPKVRVDGFEFEYPSLGGRVCAPLRSSNGREDFYLDVSRGRIDLMKGKYQNRARETVVLVRLDFGGAPHTNPDGTRISCPHLHVYREGYGYKWAVALPAHFTKLGDLWHTLDEFMSYCNVIDPPRFKRGLFV